MPRPEKQLDFNYSTIFHNAFVPIWIENIAPLYQQFSELKKSGVEDLGAYLEEFPEEIRQLAAKIEILDVNEATVTMYGAKDKNEFLGKLNQIMSTVDEGKFAAALVSFWNQDDVFSLESTHQSLDGKPLTTIISARIPRFDSKELVIPVTITDITALKEKQESLTLALEEIKTLRGIIPICASCKNIRDRAGYWNQLEAYISDRTEAQFTHGICPECCERLYPLEEGEEP